MSLLLHTSSLLNNVKGVVHAFTTREGGISSGPYASLNLSQNTPDDRAHIASNRQTVLSALGRPDAAWISAHQVHGQTVVQVTANAGRSLEADGLWTDDPDCVVAVLVADCVPILMADRDGRALAAVHAGWRGTRDRVAKIMVERLAQAGFPPDHLRVAIGPAIGPCCFSIGEDVAEELAAVAPDEDLVRPAEDGRLRADLWGLNRRIIQAAGVPAEWIEELRVCTACSSEFFSHRADGGTTGRQAAVIGLA